MYRLFFGICYLLLYTIYIIYYFICAFNCDWLLLFINIWVYVCSFNLIVSFNTDIIFIYFICFCSCIYYVNYMLTTYNNIYLIPSGYPLGGYDSTPYFFRCSRWEKNKKTLFHSTLFISFISKFVHNHNLWYNLLER